MWFGHSAIKIIDWFSHTKLNYTHLVKCKWWQSFLLHGSLSRQMVFVRRSHHLACVPAASSSLHKSNVEKCLNTCQFYCGGRILSQLIFHVACFLIGCNLLWHGWHDSSNIHLETELNASVSVCFSLYCLKTPLGWHTHTYNTFLKRTGYHFLNLISKTMK